MWKKSISTLLIFLFTLSPFQPLFAMDYQDAGQMERPQPKRYIRFPGDTPFRNTKHFLAHEHWLTGASVTTFAALFEVLHRGGQVATLLPKLLLRPLLKPDNADDVVKFFLLLSTVLGTIVVAARDDLKDVVARGGVNNGTMETDLVTSSYSSSKVSAEFGFGFYPNGSMIPNWQPLPNYSIPMLPFSGFNFSLPTFNFSIPNFTLPGISLPNASAPVPFLPPAALPENQLSAEMLESLQNAINDQLALIGQDLNQKLAAWEQQANSNIQRMAATANEQGNRLLEAMQKANGDIQSLVKNANALGESQVLELRTLVEDLAVSETLRLEVPAVDVDFTQEMGFGARNLSSSIDPIQIGQIVRAILPALVINGIISYEVATVLFLAGDEFFEALIPWYERIQPLKQFFGSVLFDYEESENLDFSGTDQSFGSFSEIFERIHRGTQHPAVRATKVLVLCIGLNLLAAAFVGELINNRNYSYGGTYASPKNNASNETGYGEWEQGSFPFPSGNFEYNATAQGYTRNVAYSFLSISFFAGLSGFKDSNEADILLIAGALFIGAYILTALLEKVSSLNIGEALSLPSQNKSMEVL
jgi:hypothetical protein